MTLYDDYLLGCNMKYPLTFLTRFKGKLHRSVQLGILPGLAQAAGEHKQKALRSAVKAPALRLLHQQFPLCQHLKGALRATLCWPQRMNQNVFASQQTNLGALQTKMKD